MAKRIHFPEPYSATGSSEASTATGRRLRRKLTSAPLKSADPIFSLIEQHVAAKAEDKDEASHDRAMAAYDRVWSTAPRSRSGLRAWLRYLIDDAEEAADGLIFGGRALADLLRTAERAI